MVHHLSLLFLLLPALATSQTIPTEISSSFSETTSLLVSLPPHELSADSNITLPLEDTKQTPRFLLGDSDGINLSAVYVILCYDPDAPQNVSSVLHYLNTNYSPSGNGTQLSSSNDEPIVSWAPPAPPRGSGNHRYIFLMFRQRPREGFQVQGIQDGVRIGFDPQAWWEENELEPPIAGAVFLANAEDQGAVDDETDDEADQDDNDDADDDDDDGDSDDAPATTTSATDAVPEPTANDPAQSPSAGAGSDAATDSGESGAGRGAVGGCALLSALAVGIVGALL